MPTKRQLDQQNDLAGSVKRFTGIAVDLIERYSRLAEEYDSHRLAIEEIRELLNDYFGESARWADAISKRLDRLEQYTILSRVGDSRAAGNITQQVTGEHIHRGLREQLGEQQELLLQYHRNVERVKLRIAKYGETIPLMNELDDYEREIAKITEAIERIREALK